MYRFLTRMSWPDIGLSPNAKSLIVGKRPAGIILIDSRVPSVYGGDGQVKEVAAAPAGLGASARALVQFIHLHAVWGNGGRAPNSARAGSTPGTSTYAWSRGDGVDVAFVINTRNWPPNAAATLVDDLSKSLDGMLSANPIA